MESGFDSEATEDLPPPPPIPPNVIPIKVDPEENLPPKKATKPSRVPMPRPGLGKKGQVVPLLTNHFKVSVRNVDDYFYHYSVGSGFPFIAVSITAKL